MALLHDLPQDVLDALLLGLPDFSALSAALRASKRLYDAFISHPRSIALAIAFNVVGPALPQAARLVHYTEDYETLLDEPAVLDRPLNRHLCTTLQGSAAVVANLEALFSLRHKDRSSPMSRLTNTESLRFRRAIYRFWLYCEFFIEDRDDDEDEGDSDSDVTQSRNAKPLLESLPADELLELERVANFLQEMCKWINTSSSSALHPNEISPSESAYMQGPEVIWDAYKGTQAYSYWGGDAMFTVQLSDILSRRRVSDEEHRLKLSTAILDVVNGIDDVCHRCYGAQGVHLWGRSNWHLLRGFLSVGNLAHMLDGRLPMNGHETNQLRAHVQRLDPHSGVMAFNWSDFLQEVCDMDVDAEGPWDTDKWYCMDCIRHLLQTRLRKWWIATKVSLHGPLKEDCWYGFHCRTQVHRRTHAEKLNHLCEPTRGDGAAPLSA